MSTITSFKPLVGKNAKVLILGSMPGETSLEMNQYYAHPRNCFWFILSQLFGFEIASDYQTRAKLVTKRGISIWDVLKTCSRSGSLDSAIKPASAIVNNFDLFFSENCAIKTIFFNGAKAEELYKKHILLDISREFKRLKLYRLPSTSPAFAAMRPQEKLVAWNIVKEKLEAQHHIKAS